MKLIFGYDVVTSNGVIPNCLNPKFLPTIYEGAKFNYERARDYFIEKWSIDFAVFNGHEFDSVSTNKSIYEIINDRKKKILITNGIILLNLIQDSIYFSVKIQHTTRF